MPSETQAGGALARSRVLIVADDLTGAMDSAGPFAGRGLPVWVVADSQRCDPASLRGARVVALNTESRHLPAAEAARRVRAAIRRLGRDFGVLLKKIDSTLRGNVVAETLAMLSESGRGGALVAPAFPDQGRTMSGGIVSVNGVELGRTDFARDALSPPPTAPLHEVFAAASKDFRARLTRARDLAFGEHEILVMDAADNADLASAAAFLMPHLDKLLLAGSAGLTQALAAQGFAGKLSPAPRPGVEGPVIFAVGSRAEASAAQVEILAADSVTAVLSLPNGSAEQPRFPPSAHLVLRATAGDVAADAEQVAANLSRHTLDAVRATGAHALVATGGDTAMALLNLSGNSAVQVHGDLLPGIPCARIVIDGRPIWLVTKAGGFGGKTALRDIAVELRRGRQC